MTGGLETSRPPDFNLRAGLNPLVTYSERTTARSTNLLDESVTCESPATPLIRLASEGDSHNRDPLRRVGRNGTRLA